MNKDKKAVTAEEIESIAKKEAFFKESLNKFLFDPPIIINQETKNVIENYIKSLLVECFGYEMSQKIEATVNINPESSTVSLELNWK